jgi:dTDP-D-glucose 4,6-dehydratase
MVFVTDSAGFISSNFVLADHLRAIVRFAGGRHVSRSIDVPGELILTYKMVGTFSLLDEARHAALKIRPKASILR